MRTDIVIGIPTVGDSSERINACLDCIQRFTGQDVKVVVSYDGPGMKDSLATVCSRYGAHLVFNDDPDMARNVDSLFRHTTEEWVFILDDGILVNKGWLDPIFRILDNFKDQEFETTKGPARIGVLGINQVVVQHLVVAGLMKTDMTWQEWVIDWMDRLKSPAYYQCYADFYNNYWRWNTGNISWEDICAGVDKWHDANPGYEGTPFINRFAPFSHQTQIGTGAPFALRRELWEKMEGGFPKGWTFYEWWVMIQAMHVNNYVPLLLWAPPIFHLQGSASVQVADMQRPSTNKEIEPMCIEMFGKTMPEMTTGAAPSGKRSWTRLQAWRRPARRNRLRPVGRK